MLDPRDPLSIKTLSSTTAAANAEAITASYVCVVNGAITGRNPKFPGSGNLMKCAG